MHHGLGVGPPPPRVGPPPTRVGPPPPPPTLSTHSLLFLHSLHLPTFPSAAASPRGRWRPRDSARRISPSPLHSSLLSTHSPALALSPPTPAASRRAAPSPQPPRHLAATTAPVSGATSRPPTSPRRIAARVAEPATTAPVSGFTSHPLTSPRRIAARVAEPTTTAPSSRDHRTMLRRDVCDCCRRTHGASSPRRGCWIPSPSGRIRGGAGLRRVRRWIRSAVPRSTTPAAPVRRSDPFPPLLFFFVYAFIHCIFCVFSYDLHVDPHQYLISIFCACMLYFVYTDYSCMERPGVCFRGSG